MTKRRHFLRNGLWVGAGIAFPGIVRAIPVNQRRIVPRPAAGGYTCPPSDFSGLAAWWKADSLSLADGTAIDTWTDSSGNGKDATATLTARPVFKTNIFGSLPAVRFDGSNDFFSFTSIPLGNFGTNPVFTLIHVGTQTADGVLIGFSANNMQLGRVNYLANTLKVAVYFGTATDVSSDFGSALSNLKMTSIRQAAANGTGKFRENKTARSVGWSEDASIGDADANRIGRASFGQFIAGDIAELCLWTTSLSDTDVDCMYTGYFQPKYGLL